MSNCCSVTAEPVSVNRWRVSHTEFSIISIYVVVVRDTVLGPRRIRRIGFDGLKGAASRAC